MKLIGRRPRISMGFYVKALGKGAWRDACLFKSLLTGCPPAVRLLRNRGVHYFENLREGFFSFRIRPRFCHVGAGFRLGF